MTTAPAFSARGTLRWIGARWIGAPLMVLLAASALAQVRGEGAVLPATTLSLPDAPGFGLKHDDAEREMAGGVASSRVTAEREEDGEGADGPTTPAAKRHRRIATLSDMTIQPGKVSQPLTRHRTVVLGLTQSFTLFSGFGWLASAGYTQLVNGSPNYGVDSGAFGQRLGAAALRNTSQNILGNAVLAPLLRQDPRYYKLGRQSSMIHRTAYAVTRVLITKNDDGNERPNLSLLGGHLAGAALTNLYYPDHNQGWSQTGKTFGNALGGAAVGYLVTEFIDDGLRLAHLQRLE